MYLNNLTLKNYRNYESLDISFDKGLQIITGKNGVGKTNILEAINFLSSTRSFRKVSDSILINWNRDFFFIQASLYAKNNMQKLSTVYSLTKKKYFKYNNTKIQKAKDFFGLMRTVTFLPEDIFLISGSPSVRRQFIDNLLSQIFVNSVQTKIQGNYLTHIIDFYSILKQRNFLLKKESKIFDSYNEIYIEKSIQIVFFRVYVLYVLLFPKIQKILGQLDNFPFQIDFAYSIFLETFNDLMQNKKNSIDIVYDSIKKYFYELAIKSFDKEKQLGMTLFGPHREDMLIRINNQKANNILSQGQKRIVSIAIKLAELELLKETLMISPIILIDDIMNELDKEKYVNMIQVICKSEQSFIATTDNNLPSIANNLGCSSYSVYKVQSNSIYKST